MLKSEGPTGLASIFFACGSLNRRKNRTYDRLDYDLSSEKFNMTRSTKVFLVAAAALGLAPLAPAFAVEINVDNVQLPYSESLNLNGTIDGSSYSADNQLAGQIALTVNTVG